MTKLITLAVVLASIPGCCLGSDGRSIVPVGTPVAPPAPQPVMVALEGRSLSCDWEHTNLFQPDYRVTSQVVNDDVEGGTFTVQIYGQYPGGGERLEGTGSVTLGPRQQGRVQTDIHGQGGITGVRCLLVRPQVQRWR